MATLPWFTLESDDVLLLRACRADRTSFGEFQYPSLGDWVEAPDWNPAPQCGGGLHGLPWGAGDSRAIDWTLLPLGIVLRVHRGDGYIKFEGKAKCRRAQVVCEGGRDECVAFISRYAPPGTQIHYSVGTSGYAGWDTLLEYRDKGCYGYTKSRTGAPSKPRETHQCSRPTIMLYSRPARVRSKKRV